MPVETNEDVRSREAFTMSAFRARHGTELHYVMRRALLSSLHVSAYCSSKIKEESQELSRKTDNKDILCCNVISVLITP
jgi:hypothetical protein